ncbi:hypothetical protein ACSYGW_02210 [Bacillus glycinifermentans]
MERHLTFENDHGETANDLLIGRVVCIYLAMTYTILNTDISG